jgi:hypothetical protein
MTRPIAPNARRFSPVRCMGSRLRPGSLMASYAGTHGPHDGARNPAHFARALALPVRPKQRNATARASGARAEPTADRPEPELLLSARAAHHTPFRPSPRDQRDAEARRPAAGRALIDQRRDFRQRPPRRNRPSAWARLDGSRNASKYTYQCQVRT